MHNFLWTKGLSGFLSIGPAFLLFVFSATDKKYEFSFKEILHYAPAFILLMVWSKLNFIWYTNELWNLVYQSIMLQYIIYILVAINKINKLSSEMKLLKKQLNIISILLLIIWFTYLLNAVTHFFPYIAGAIIYSIIIYFSISLIINKGYVLSFISVTKYEKTTINTNEKQRLIKELTNLFEKEKIYKSNTVSLSKLAKKLNTSTHLLSLVINSEKGKTYFELMVSYRVKNLSSKRWL